MLKYLLTGILATGFLLVGPEVKEADARRNYRHHGHYGRNYYRPNYRYQYNYRYNYSPRRYRGNYRYNNWGNHYRYNNYRRGGVGFYYNF